jgi:leader peptidase (prepilin peptidase) / N-methyltransferase
MNQAGLIQAGILEAGIAFLFGLLIGSFLNVCIFRLPRGRSVVAPRSYCPWCRHPIAWYDNIPVLSYILLRARCRYCGRKIWARYIVVELVTGALFFVAVFNLGLTVAAAKLCVFGALMIGMIFTDLERRILPDEFTLGGTAAGLVFSLFVPLGFGLVSFILSLKGVDWPPREVSLAESLTGALLPSGLLWFTGFVFEKVRHKEGLGLGDVKMMMTVGAFLGVRGALGTLVVGSVLGSIVGLAYILILRKDAGSYPLPFGTFLGIAAFIIALLEGVRIVT